MVLQSPKVRFQEPKYSLRIQCGCALPPNDYETFLPLHHTSRFGNVFFDTGKVIFETHIVTY